MTDARSAVAHGVESLSRMPECELADGAPDVRGWEVTTPTSMHVGIVKDLLVDLASMHVRYLDAVLDAGPSTRRVLIPIGKVWISDALDQIVIADTSFLDALPDYSPAAFDRDFEHRVLASVGESGGAGTDFYASPAFGRGHFQRGRPEPVHCRRREDDTDADCAVDDAANPPEAANGVELPVVTDAAAD